MCTCALAHLCVIPHTYKKGLVCAGSIVTISNPGNEKGVRKQEELLGPHCRSFPCWLIEVTILMSVTSSCHDKPLWAKPVLSLAGSLPLPRCSYSTSSSLPTKGANLTTIMCERGRCANRKHRCVSVISHTHTQTCCRFEKRGKEMKRKQEDKCTKSLTFELLGL